MKSHIKLLQGLGSIVPILAFRSLFSFERGGYSEVDDGEGSIEVTEDEAGSGSKLLFIKGLEGPVLTATEVVTKERHSIHFTASLEVEKAPSLLLLIAALGLHYSRTDEGYSFALNFGKTEFGDGEFALPEIEVMWNRVEALDALWVANSVLSRIEADPVAIVDHLVSVHQKAHVWHDLRSAPFLDKPKRVKEQVLKKCMDDMRNFAAWCVPGMTGLRVVDEVRCATAFEMKFGERISLYVKKLDVNWAVAPTIGSQARPPQSVYKGKYAIRPTKIPNEVVAVLDGLLVQGNTVKIVKELPKKLYGKVNAMLETIGGKWNTSAQAHVFEDDPQELLDEMTATGAVYTRKDFEFFETQEQEVNRVLALVGLEKGMTVLEPSAGRGAFALAAARVVGKNNVICYELMDKNVRALRAAGFHVKEPQDFMALEPCEVADVVLMNPPFSGGRDIAHIQHAYKFLKPGGRLMAIASTQWETHNNGRSQDFKAFLGALDASVSPIEAGAFSEVGTDVPTTLITLQKPAKAVKASKQPEPSEPICAPNSAALEEMQAELF